MRLTEEKFEALKAALGEEWALRVRALVEGQGDPLASKEMGGLRTGYKAQGGNVVTASGAEHSAPELRTVYVGLRRAEKAAAVPRSPMVMSAQEGIEAIQLHRLKESPQLGEVLPGRVYAVAELAHLLSCNERTLTNLLAAGKLRGSKSVGKGWRVLGSEAIRLLTS